MQGPVDETDYDIQTNTVRKQGNLRYLSLVLLRSLRLLNISFGLLYSPVLAAVITFSYTFPSISGIHVFSCIVS